MVGLCFSAFASALSRHSQLGVSPLTSVANLMSYAVPSVSFGTWLFIWNCLLVIAQIAVLRREYDKVQLLQIPMSLIFGAMTDLAVFLTGSIPVESYFSRFVILTISIFLSAVGVCIAVTADVLMNSGEALVAAVAKKVPMRFGTIKICFDIFYVILAVIMCLLLLNGKIVGIREGTVLAAVFTGAIVNLILPSIRKMCFKLTGIK